jgi:hypothetical protein
MSYIPRMLRFAVPAMALLVAACNNPSSDKPNRVSWDPASTTDQGTGTNGGTNVDGAGPGGPRDPNRLVTPNAYAPPETTSGSVVTDPDDPNMNPHSLRGVH